MNTIIEPTPTTIKTTSKAQKTVVPTLEKIAARPAAVTAPPKQPKSKPAANAKASGKVMRDALGGMLSSKTTHPLNLLILEAGTKGVTTSEIGDKCGQCFGLKKTGKLIKTEVEGRGTVYTATPEILAAHKANKKQPKRVSGSIAN